MLLARPHIVFLLSLSVSLCDVWQDFEDDEWFIATTEGTPQTHIDNNHQLHFFKRRNIFLRGAHSARVKGHKGHNVARVKGHKGHMNETPIEKKVIPFKFKRNKNMYNKLYKQFVKKFPEKPTKGPEYKKHFKIFKKKVTKMVNKKKNKKKKMIKLKLNYFTDMTAKEKKRTLKKLAKEKSRGQEQILSHVLKEHDPYEVTDTSDIKEYDDNKEIQPDVDELPADLYVDVINMPKQQTS